MRRCRQRNAQHAGQDKNDACDLQVDPLRAVRTESESHDCTDGYEGEPSPRSHLHIVQRPFARYSPGMKNSVTPTPGSFSSDQALPPPSSTIRCALPLLACAHKKPGPAMHRNIQRAH
jgi:hypothetical protein